MSLIKSIQLTNFLSFGEASKPVELGPLNVIIGPNGAGKSNFIEAFDLLRAAPSDLFKPVREGGGVRDWLWRQGAVPNATTATIDAVVNPPLWIAVHGVPLHYRISFASDVFGSGTVTDERIESARPLPNDVDMRYIYYDFQKSLIDVLSPPSGSASALNAGGKRNLQPIQEGAIDSHASVLSQYRGMHYPELTVLGYAFGNMRSYREWSFGRYTIPRLPQKTDLPNGHLEPDASNLNMVLNRMQGEPEVKQRLIEGMKALYDGIDDFHVSVEAGNVMVYLNEGRRKVPATRLSDGTLRYLCLLAILCDPNPGPLVCIEEPELGLHPDVLSTLAGLMREASKRTQLVITTHSDILVDAFTDAPEMVLVAEKSDEGTCVERLDAEKLKHWLSKYSLGELWVRGDIGGNRW